MNVKPNASAVPGGLPGPPGPLQDAARWRRLALAALALAVLLLLLQGWRAERFDARIATAALAVEAARAAAAPAPAAPRPQAAERQRSRHQTERRGFFAAALALTALALSAGLLARRAARLDPGARPGSIPTGEADVLLPLPLHDVSGRGTSFTHVAADVAEPRVSARPAADSPLPAADAFKPLPHRAAVIDRVQRALAHAARHPGYGFALLSIGVDRFEQVHHSLGAAAGDELLQQIAARLQHALRPGDALARQEPGAGLRQPLAARGEGAGFVAVLDGVNSAERLAAVAQRVLEELAEPYVVGLAPLNSSVSIGAVLHLAAPRPTGGGDGDDEATPPLTPGAQALLRQADTASVDAERAGGGRWALYDGAVAERVGRTLALEAELRRALAGDELFVVYQPWLDLRSGAVACVAGVEALLRWRHPQRGVLLPADFLGTAESGGMSHALAQQVLSQASTQFVQWRQELGEQAPPRLAVKLSPAQLRHPALVEDVAAGLQRCGMQAAWLQIELTEDRPAQGVAGSATLRALTALKALKALGVGLALDEFGTGYASLACLHQLPVDTVKIDRSLVAQAGTVEHHRVLLESTVRMALTLGLCTVADGVETQAQAALMAALQCQQVQGDLYCRPLEAVAMAAWLRAQALQPA